MTAVAAAPAHVPFASEGSVREIVHRFEKCTMSRGEWNHRAHLTVAMWYLTRHAEPMATELMIRGIRRFNHANGIQGSRRGGYHETMTLFWLGIGRRMVAALPNSPALDLVNRFLALPKTLPFECYSENRLWSCEARSHWVPPDRKSLDALVAEFAGAPSRH